MYHIVCKNDYSGEVKKVIIPTFLQVPGHYFLLKLISWEQISCKTNYILTDESLIKFVFLSTVLYIKSYS